MTNRVDLLLEIGVGIDTAIAIDDEVSRLPERTQRVFDMRVRGYTQREIGRTEGITKQAVSMHQKKCINFKPLIDFFANSVPYRSRG